MEKRKFKRWIAPITLLLITTGIWLSWWRTDPRLLAIKYVSASPFRNFICGFKTFDLFESLHAVLPILGWIALAGGVLTFLAAWLKKEWLGFFFVFSLTAIVYAFSASLNISDQSDAPHYVYLADAFVQGKVVLDERPPNWQENDWTKYENEWSISFPPSPALLMMPFVAVFGKSFNDVVFTVLVGAINVAIFHQLIPRVANYNKQHTNHRKLTQILLTIAFGFGTVHWWLASFGQVWFTAQIVATTFLLLTLIEIFGKGSPYLASTWLSLAALARPPILLALPILIWLLLKKNNPKTLTIGLIPLGISGLGMGFYNFVRFGNPLELGYQYMQLELLLAKRVEVTGSFNFIYLSENLQNALVKLPEWKNTCPILVMDGWGLSMLMSTPILFLIFLAPWRQRITRMIALAAFLVATPSLLYYNTGYLQAGYRYALDFLPFLFILVVWGMQEKLFWLNVSLTILSVLMGFLSLVNFYLLANGII